MSNAHSEHYPGPIHQPPVHADRRSDAHGHAGDHRKLQHHFDIWPSSSKPRRSGCGPSWSPRSCSSAGCSWPTWYTDPCIRGFSGSQHHLNVIWGAVNTIVLIVSSLTMALAVRAAQTSAPPKTQVGWILATMVLGSAFLGVKVIEYADKFKHHLVPGSELRVGGELPAGRGDLLLAVLLHDGLHACT